MAFVRNFNPDDDQTEQTGQIASTANPTLSSGASSTDISASSTGQPGSYVPAQQEGTGFTNLQKYLDANRQGAMNVGQKVSGQIQGAAQEAQGVFNPAAQQFMQQVKQGTNIFNPNAVEGDTEDLTGYAGPQNFAGSEQDRMIQEKLRKAQQVGDLASTQSGQTQLIRNASPNIRQGAANLNQFLVQNTAPAWNQVAAAAEQVKGLEPQYNAFTNQMQNAVQQGIQTSAQTRVRGLEHQNQLATQRAQSELAAQQEAQRQALAAAAQQQKQLQAEAEARAAQQYQQAQAQQEAMLRQYQQQQAASQAEQQKQFAAQQAAAQQEAQRAAAAQQAAIQAAQQQAAQKAAAAEAEYQRQLAAQQAQYQQQQIAMQAALAQLQTQQKAPAPVAPAPAPVAPAPAPVAPAPAPVAPAPAPVAPAPAPVAPAPAPVAPAPAPVAPAPNPYSFVPAGYSAPRAGYYWSPFEGESGTLYMQEPIPGYTAPTTTNASITPTSGGSTGNVKYAMFADGGYVDSNNYYQALQRLALKPLNLAQPELAKGKALPKVDWGNGNAGLYSVLGTGGGSGGNESVDLGVSAGGADGGMSSGLSGDATNASNAIGGINAPNDVSDQGNPVGVTGPNSTASAVGGFLGSLAASVLGVPGVLGKSIGQTIGANISVSAPTGDTTAQAMAQMDAQAQENDAISAAANAAGFGGDGGFSSSGASDGTAGVGIGEGGIGSSGAGTAAGDAAGNSEGSGGAADGSGSSGGDGSGCVIATALVHTGNWKPAQKDALITWCENTLHGTKLGECLRRGYQVVSSKIVVPHIRKNGFASKYLQWSFENATKLLQKEEVPLISIPNSAVWMTAMMVTGSLVSTRYARKTWVNLYRKQK